MMAAKIQATAKSAAKGAAMASQRRVIPLMP
jgi:hypothetical protein